LQFWTSFVEGVQAYLPLLLEGAWASVQVAAGALALALAGGLLLAIMTLARSRIARWPARAYIELIRGTPALTQLFIIYFGLSDVGLGLPPMAAAIIGLGVNGSAYLAEVYRAGLSAVDRGQREAALSLGLPPATALRFVVLPQAVRIMVPPFCNYGIQLLKDTSLISSVAVPEIMFQARILVGKTYESMQIYLLVALIYMAIAIPLSLLASRLERRLKIGR
jgi:His/Glu/Gln/Arg/opine family amino acid ABC transporter permease subunit